jgi:hypothetical protein
MAFIVRSLLSRVVKVGYFQSKMGHLRYVPGAADSRSFASNH